MVSLKHLRVGGRKEPHTHIGKERTRTDALDRVEHPDTVKLTIGKSALNEEALKYFDRIFDALKAGKKLDPAVQTHLLHVGVSFDALQRLHLKGELLKPRADVDMSVYKSIAKAGFGLKPLFNAKGEATTYNVLIHRK